MRIDSVELFRVPLFGANGTASSLAAVVVAIRSGELVGLGETTLPAAPTQSAEWAAGAFRCLTDWLGPAIVGRELDSGEHLQQHLAPFLGNAAAKSALDLAWWNLVAAQSGQPLSRVLGQTQSQVQTGQTFGLAPSIDELLSNIQTALDADCPLVTLKVRPGWDLQVVRAVRQTFPNAPLAVDCDGSGTIAQMDTFYRLEDFFLAEIIDPLSADDLVGLAMLKQAIRTPLVLERSVTSNARLEQIIDLDCCHKVRVNLARVGGITPALELARTCSEVKLPWSVASDPAGAVAVGAAVALACSGDPQLISSIPWPIAYRGSGDEPIMPTFGKREERWRLPAEHPRLDIELSSLLGSQMVILERARVGL